ncbi:phospholipase A [Winogradskyella forsetii]|uniref:phospholipase A n=1 Tax=Winogradskyella forsetii TaxID=2686077 RepID=UPI0015BC92DA|nr:phospholipase A [Winogradskyella forsetii]
MKRIFVNQWLSKWFGFIITMFITLNSYSQAYTKKELNDSIAKQPYFSIHKDNYFLTGVPTNKAINKSTADAKYQISFKQILTRSKLPWDTYLFLTYTQKSFWNIYKESFPFSDINFNPSIAIGKAFYDKDKKLKGIGTLSFEHESNGRDSIASRSWNRLSLEYSTKVAKNTIGRFKVWVPFAYKEGNPDLLEYTGLGQVNLSHIIKKDKLFFDLRFRKGLNLDLKGSVRTRVYFNPFDNNISNQYIMLEWFVGQAEGLLNYQQSQSMIRIGYVIRTNEFKWLRGK